MKGRIEDGEEILIAPSIADELEIGDIMLARIRGKRYFHLVLHLIHARNGDSFLIGNNFGREDGWVEARDIFGKVLKTCT
jgi:hypothetical protein